MMMMISKIDDDDDDACISQYENDKLDQLQYYNHVVVLE